CVAKLLLRPWANRDSVGLRGDSRERSMMGRREGGQGQFFYAFDLDKVVPPDHLVRQIDNVIDLSWVHQELTPYYSDTGRPSIDPVLMIRMLIVGYGTSRSCNVRRGRTFLRSVAAFLADGVGKANGKLRTKEGPGRTFIFIRDRKCPEARDHQKVSRSTAV